jgi:hypothetical protein
LFLSFFLCFFVSFLQRGRRAGGWAACPKILSVQEVLSRIRKKGADFRLLPCRIDPLQTITVWFRILGVSSVWGRGPKLGCEHWPWWHETA